MRSGDDHAFRLIVEKYRTELFRVIYAILRDQKDAEDATQEVFIKIYHSLSTFENQGLKTWMTRIAVNHAIDSRRKRERRREEMTEQLAFQAAVSAKDHVEAEVMLTEKQRLVREKLDQLPGSYREVVYDFYIAEKSYQQMADEQQVQVKTIETKLYRARQWMKKHWKEEEF
ncbi:sigma-70 family RNA polymerase sigma factor [Alkalihalobacillus oceani]|uniref:Sigma-70 family RNA polymerase sigma factor n=1 Tax=Halalkalibacter oceani TaxID=1653776 RepID=A0A9X2DNW6_9BACI|nr:sigma-70 family RNA polymerase sigma factor [Halalkalibacter oceani]MCM3713385.1 sigma-70 family RNA polymerase sigma factor [Halalkalibacter oceani]